MVVMLPDEYLYHIVVYGSNVSWRVLISYLWSMVAMFPDEYLYHIVVYGSNVTWRVLISYCGLW